MPENVEIKARLRDRDAVRARVVALANSGPEVLDQEDTFFAVDRGRLKLRRFGDGHSELIFYCRDDRAGPATSRFWKAACAAPAELRALLDAALGEVGSVSKRRELFLVGRTRVHLDLVEGLGAYLELEVMLSDEQSEADGSRIASELLNELGIAAEDLEPVAYVDLLRKTAT